MVLDCLFTGQMNEGMQNISAWLLRYEALQSLGAHDAIPAGWHPAEVRRVEAAAAEPPVPTQERPPIEAADIAALRARFEALRVAHATCLSRTATVIARSRALRTTGRAEQGREAA